MSNKHIELHLPGDQLEIREGPAAPFPWLPNEKDVLPEAVAAYVLGRPDLEAGEAYAVVNYEARTLRLEIGESTTQRGTISAILPVHPDWEAWGINAAVGMQSAQLLNHIRPRKRFFTEPAEYDRIVRELTNFRAKVETEQETVRDGKAGVRGDAKKHTVTQVNTGGMKYGDPADAIGTFKISCPVLRGGSAREIHVDVLMDPADGTVRFYLESIDVHEIIYTEGRERIGAALKVLDGRGIPVLEV